MLNLIRAILAILGLILLSAGYIASQLAYQSGRAAEYAHRIDSPPIKNLALLLLIGSIVLAFLPRQEDVETE